MVGSKSEKRRPSARVEGCIARSSLGGVKERDERKLEGSYCWFKLGVVSFDSVRLLVRVTFAEWSKDVEGCKGSCTRA